MMRKFHQDKTSATLRPRAKSYGQTTAKSRNQSGRLNKVALAIVIVQRLALALEMGPMGQETSLRTTNFDDDELDKSSLEANAAVGPQQEPDEFGLPRSNQSNKLANPPNFNHDPHMQHLQVQFKHLEPEDSDDRLPKNLVSFDENDSPSSRADEAPTLSNLSASFRFIANSSDSKSSRGKRKSEFDQAVGSNQHHSFGRLSQNIKADRGDQPQPEKMIAYSLSKGSDRLSSELVASQSSQARTVSGSEKPMNVAPPKGAKARSSDTVPSSIERPDLQLDGRASKNSENFSGSRTWPDKKVSTQEYTPKGIAPRLTEVDSKQEESTRETSTDTSPNQVTDETEEAVGGSSSSAGQEQNDSSNQDEASDQNDESSGGRNQTEAIREQSQAEPTTTTARPSSSDTFKQSAQVSSLKSGDEQSAKQELLVGPFKSEAEAPATITLSGITYRKSGISSKISAFRSGLQESSRGPYPVDEADKHLIGRPLAAQQGSQVLYLNSQADARPKAMRSNEMQDLWSADKQSVRPQQVQHQQLQVPSALRGHWPGQLSAGSYFRISPQFMGRINEALMGTSSGLSGGGGSGADWRLSNSEQLEAKLKMMSAGDSQQAASVIATALDYQPELSSSGSSSDSVRVQQQPHIQLISGPVKSPVSDVNAANLLKSLSAEIGPLKQVQGQPGDLHLLESLAAESNAAKHLSKTAAEQHYLNLLAGAASEKHYENSSHPKDKGPIVIVEKNVKPAKYHLLRAYLKLRRFLRPADATYVFPGTNSGLLRRSFLSSSA